MTEPATSEQVQIGRALRLDRRSALDLLRDLARDGAALADLRRLWARESASTTLCFSTDEQVLSQLADRIASGRLVVARVPPRRPRTPPPGEGAVDGAVEAEGASESEQPADKPALMSPRWSVDRVEVGAELDAEFTYVGCEPNQPVTIKVYEVNANGTKKQVDTLTVAVPAKSGDHKAPWKRDPDKASADLEEDQEEGDTGPLEYRFTVEADGVGATGLSDKLWLTNTVTVNLEDEEGAALEKSRIVVLKDHEREQRAASKDGKAEFKKVLVGPVDVRLAEPRFTDLGWSAPKVPVGEAVEAVFKYEDAIDQMKVAIAIHEFNADGTTKQVDRIEDIALKGEQGEARVSWTRSEEDAQADLVDDELEGDAGPLEYRYYVVTEDENTSEASDRLWLTQTVEVTIAGEDAGAPGSTAVVGVTLRDATGEEKRVEASDGVATFDDIVIGRFTIRLDDGASPLKVPTFSGLQWSEPRVEVGGTVEAVFSFENAETGQTAFVHVLEADADGSMSEVDVIATTLEGEQGELRVPWSRTPEAAARDLEEDQAAADTGPLSYHFAVSTSNTWSDLCPAPLWLINTVIVNVPPDLSERSRDGYEVTLNDASGAELKATVTNGQARFEGVVVGPMTITLAAHSAP